MPATELLVLHDPESEKSLATIFVETEGDCRQGNGKAGRVGPAHPPCLDPWYDATSV